MSKEESFDEMVELLRKHFADLPVEEREKRMADVRSFVDSIRPGQMSRNGRGILRRLIAAEEELFPNKEKRKWKLN